MKVIIDLNQETVIDILAYEYDYVSEDRLPAKLSNAQVKAICARHLMALSETARLRDEKGMRRLTKYLRSWANRIAISARVR